MRGILWLCFAGMALAIAPAAADDTPRSCIEETLEPDFEVRAGIALRQGGAAVTLTEEEDEGIDDCADDFSIEEVTAAFLSIVSHQMFQEALKEFRPYGLIAYDVETCYQTPSDAKKATTGERFVEFFCLKRLDGRFDPLGYGNDAAAQVTACLSDKARRPGPNMRDQIALANRLYFVGFAMGTPFLADLQQRCVRKTLGR